MTQSRQLQGYNFKHAKDLGDLANPQLVAEYV